MLEDIYRLRRDMMLFMTRSGALAKALKSGADTSQGSSAIGFMAMSSALFQISKVFRNYLAVIDKEIEDIEPGVVDRLDNEELLDTLTDIKSRVDTRERPKDIPPAAIQDMVHPHETYEQTNQRLLPIYREAHHMKERLIADGDHYKEDRKQWEMKARKCDLVMFWMHGRMIETV